MIALYIICTTGSKTAAVDEGSQRRLRECRCRDRFQFAKYARPVIPPHFNKTAR